MLNETKQHFFKRFIEDTVGYYRIYDFLKIRVRNLVSPAIEFQSSKDFWESIHQGDFKGELVNRPSMINGQIITLRDFFLTEWVPKLPGRVWTNDGDLNLMAGLQDVVGEVDFNEQLYSVLGPEGKLNVLAGGLGSVRVKPRVNLDYCMLVNAVSVDSWHCDYGIPIVVSRAVYDQFLRFNHGEGAPWIESLKGVLILNNSVMDLSIISPAIGANLNRETVDLLSDMPNLQKCFIYVSSPLDIELKFNGSHPDAVAWTMFKTDISNEPLRLTYSTFNPMNRLSLRESVDFINRYVVEFNGTEILTDFDGQKRRLAAKTNPGNTKNFAWQHSRVMRNIDRWIQVESGNHQ